MSIAEQSLAHDSGEDVEVIFAHAGDDITGWAIRFRLFDHAGTQVLEKTVGDGITINSTHQYTLDLTGDFPHIAAAQQKSEIFLRSAHGMAIFYHKVKY